MTQSEENAAAGEVERITPPPLKDPTIMNSAASADHKAERFYSAARLCHDGKLIQFRDGSVWTERDLYVRAIELNPRFAPPYHNLALALHEDETLEMCGCTWSRQQFYIKAIELDPKHAASYVNLAECLGDDGRATINGSGLLDQTALLIQAINAAPHCAMAYMNLGLCLSPGARVQLLNGRVMTAADLIAIAQSFDPSCGPDVPLNIAQVQPTVAVSGQFGAAPAAVVVAAQPRTVPSAVPYARHPVPALAAVAVPATPMSKTGVPMGYAAPAAVTHPGQLQRASIGGTMVGRFQQTSVPMQSPIPTRYSLVATGPVRLPGLLGNSQPRECFQCCETERLKPKTKTSVHLRL